MPPIVKRLALLVERGTGDRGRLAASPAEIPLIGWRDILIRLWRDAREDRLNILAAGIAFYVFLALLPLIASTTMIYSLIREPGRIIADMAKLIAVVPTGAQELVTRRVVEVTSAHRDGALELLLALLLTLYGGARGARSVIAALNTIYGEGDEQRFVRRWGVPLLLAIGMAAVMLLGLITMAVFGYIDQLIPEASPAQWLAARLGFWLLVALAIAAGSAALYRYAPARRHARWVWILPGAAVATSLWLAATFGFGVYLANFDRYDLTYGSLAAVVILQLWIYLSAFALLLGAKLNAEIELQTTRDTTVGAARKPGHRRAVSADEVGEIPTIELPTPGAT